MENLIVKYLHNEISDDDLAKLSAWLDTPEHQKKFKAFVKKQVLIDQSYNAFDVSLAYRRLIQEKEGVKKLPVERKRVRKWSVLKYAAAFAFLLGLGYTFFFTPNTNRVVSPKAESQITLELSKGIKKVIDETGKKTLSISKGNVLIKQERNKLIYTQKKSQKSSETTFNTLRVPYGDTFELVLTDGTEIVLNAGSEIKYPTAFSLEGHREVYLTGEAYFHVSKDTERPFIVHTKKLNVRVLGTRFTVTAYKNDRETSAVLASGKIAATPANISYGKGQTQVIAPGERVSLKEEGMSVHTVNIEKYMAWVEGRLLFTDDPFPVIARKLERYYGIKIINQCDLLKNTSFTGSFVQKNLRDILKTFQIHSSFSYEIKEGKVIINKCKTQ